MTNSDRIEIHLKWGATCFIILVMMALVIGLWAKNPWVHRECKHMIDQVSMSCAPECATNTEYEWWKGTCAEIKEHVDIHYKGSNL